MASLPLVPLDDAVVFPGMPVTIPAISGNDRRVLLIPRRGVGYARVGVVAEVTKRHTIRGTDVMSLDALFRGVPAIAHGDQDGVLRVEVDEHPDVAPPQELTADLEREYRAVVEEILELRGDDGRISAFVRSITEPGALADTAGYSPDLNNAQKLELLETLDIVERLSLSLKFQRERLAELQVRKRIREDVENGAQKQQRDYFLRKQMDAIRKELGENEASVTEDYRKKIADAGMPENVQQQAERELSRFERLGDQNAESSVIRTYLDWLLAVPWSKRSEDGIDPQNAREVLDADHAGLEDVEGAHHRVPGGAQAAQGSRPDRRQALGRDPDARRPSRHGQDLDRRVDRQGDGTQVRAHVARRRPRRGGDPRPPAHLHRRAAGAAGPRPARRRDDEPGHPARRGRQARGTTGAAIRRRRCSRCSTRRRTTTSRITTWTCRSTCRT